METISIATDFLGGYKDQIHLAVIFGIISALVASSLSVIVYIIRYINLQSVRDKCHTETIDTGRTIGVAEGLQLVIDEKLNKIK